MKKERFSIRKTARGAVSARIAVIGLLALLGAGQEVQADVMTPGATTTVSPAGGTTVAGKQETIIISSPVTYVADDTKEVGYHEVRENGQAGSLIITETPDGKTVQRTEPTTTVEVFGTKPKVEETVTETASTEYVADDQLEAGKEVTVQEGSDGKTVTTTTYKIVLQDARRDQESTPYVGKTPYTIDNTQKLDSDKVVIDEEAVRAELADLKTTWDWVRILQESQFMLFVNSPINPQLGPVVSSVPLEDRLTDYVKNMAPSTELYADLKAAHVRYQAVLEHIRENYQGEALVDLIKSYFGEFKNELTTVTGTTEMALVLKEAGTSQNPTERLHTYELPFGYFATQNRRNHQYLKHLDAQGVAYEVVSANELKLADGQVYQISLKWTETSRQTIEDLSTEEIIKRFDEYLKHSEIGYETTTRRYNDSRGIDQGLPIVYESAKLTAEDKAWFEDKLASLPPALLRNLLRVTIGDEPLSASRTSSAIGVAYYVSREIKLNYSQMASREELLRVFIHELSHVVDYHTFSPRNFKLNHTNEFTKLFDVINPPITESSKTVAPYYQDAREEVWAEFFGQYIFHRYFGHPYVKFIEIDDKVLYLRDMNWGTTLDEVAENRANYEAYYNDPRAYSPNADLDWFFADLYTKLFEQPTVGRVEIEQVTTQVTEVKDKLVAVGTKPTVVDEVTKYTTLEVEDADLLIGDRKVTQVGKDGIVRTTTTYELVDKTTGEVKATTDTSVIQELVQEIIAVGTKPKPVAPSVQPTQPKQPTLTLVQPPSPHRPVITSPQSSDKDGQVAAGTGTSTETPSPAKPAPVLAVAATSPTRTNQSATSTPSLPKTGEAGATALAVTGFGLVLSSLGLARRRKAD